MKATRSLVALKWQVYSSIPKKMQKAGSPHVAGQHLAKNYRPSLQTCLPVIAIFQHPSSLKSWIVGGPESLPGAKHDVGLSVLPF